MKFQKHLVKYTDRRISAVCRIIELNPSYWKPETFHKLRLEIKKINAVSVITDFCIKDFHRKKIFRPFRIIFKKAGTVRDLQIEQNFLKKNKFIPGNEVPGKTLTEVKKVFFSSLRKDLFKEINKSKEKMDEGISGLRKEDVNLYFNKVFGEIEMLLMRKLNAVQLHTLRRRLKKIYFNLRSIPVRRRLPFTVLNNYLDLLGRWNDRRVTLLQLRHLTDTVTMSEIQQKKFAMMKSKLTSQSRHLRKIIDGRNKIIIPVIKRLVKESNGDFLNY